MSVCCSCTTRVSHSRIYEVYITSIIFILYTRAYFINIRRVVRKYLFIILKVLTISYHMIYDMSYHIYNLDVFVLSFSFNHASNSAFESKPEKLGPIALGCCARTSIEKSDATHSHCPVFQ